MLVLHFFIKSDAASQRLARFVQNGFRYESWKALQRAGTVYEARITALPHPDDQSKISSILLSTTYDGAPLPYQRFFWENLTPFFVKVALAARDLPPFTIEDLTPDQRTALDAADVAIVKCEQATAETFATTQLAFQAATQALALAMAAPEPPKPDGSIPKAKFDLFAEWVNRNDLTYRVGTPTAPTIPPEVGPLATHDLREPPVLSERSNFVNPALEPGPFAIDSR
jgi:hypothetical protein